MSLGGTESYHDLRNVPARVRRAVEMARAGGFETSCRAAHGILLRTLAAGVGAGVIGETGTGCGVGLAWMSAGAAPKATLVSVERDPGRAEVAQQVFADDPRVTVVNDDWGVLRAYGPFDLLFLDGGGQGKGEGPPIDPVDWLSPGGLIVMDDFTPSDSWPPTYEGAIDTARLAWLQHPRLLATELRTEPDRAALVATLRHP